LKAICSVVLFFGCISCHTDQLAVKRIANIDYPSRARFENIQGTVDVTISIGADGKVIFAKGSGAHPVLVQAAEENARQWLFGPFPSIAQFPIDHQIRYIFRLEGKPVFVGLPTKIKTHLPDSVEVVAVPMVSDYTPVTPDSPAAPKH
jgi:TonB family protein